MSKLDFANKLPILSRVVENIAQVLSSTESDTSDIVDAIKCDPVITAKVLRLANSAYTGLPKKVASLQNAVGLLGKKRIYSMVMTLNAMSSFKESHKLPFSATLFWQHSFSVGLICESIARYLKRNNAIDLGEVFCAGLLHDIGRLALGCVDPFALKNAVKKAREKNIPVYMAENDSSSHTLIGAQIAKHWNFPDTLVDSIQHHHSPDYSENVSRTVVIVHLADFMAHGIGFNTEVSELIPNLYEPALDQIGLSIERLRVIAQETNKNHKKMNKLFDLFTKVD